MYPFGNMNIDLTEVRIRLNMGVGCPWPEGFDTNYNNYPRLAGHISKDEFDTVVSKVNQIFNTTYPSYCCYLSSSVFALCTLYIPFCIVRSNMTAWIPPCQRYLDTINQGLSERKVSWGVTSIFGRSFWLSVRGIPLNPNAMPITNMLGMQQILQQQQYQIQQQQLQQLQLQQQQLQPQLQQQQFQQLQQLQPQQLQQPPSYNPDLSSTTIPSPSTVSLGFCPKCGTPRSADSDGPSKFCAKCGHPF